MKTLEIDDDIYQYIASQTLHIGESASSILRRLLAVTSLSATNVNPNQSMGFEPLLTLIKSDHFINEKKRVNRFLSILSILYLCNQSLFSVAATSLHGSKRRYLAKDEQTLLCSGSNTKPKWIPDTPYMVITNSNTARKVYIIESLMHNMSVPDQIIAQIKTQFVAK